MNTDHLLTSFSEVIVHDMEHVLTQKHTLSPARVLRSSTPLAVVLWCAALLFTSGCSGLFDDLDVEENDVTNNGDNNSTINANNQTNGDDPCEDCESDEICVDEQCVADNGDDCPDGKTLCGSNCVDKSSNDDYCGDCSRDCSSGNYCRSGTCRAIDFSSTTLASDLGEERSIDSVSLAIDGEQRLHASYAVDHSSEDFSEIFYRSAPVDGQWQPEHLLTETGPFPHHSLAVDGEDYLHLALNNSWSLGYVRTHLDALGASPTVEDLGGSMVARPSIAVDSQANPHIVHHFRDAGLHYATTGGVGWSSPTIFDGNMLRDAAIAIDDDDRVHVSFIDISSDLNEDAIYYTRRGEGSSWDTEEIDLDFTVAQNVDIAVDESHVHIVFRNRDSQTLKYARRGLDDTQWDIEPIVEDANQGSISIAVDPSGRVHVAYRTFATIPVFTHAHRAVDGEWSHTTIDADARGFTHAMVVDDNNHAHMVYAVEDSSVLQYATFGD